MSHMYGNKRNCKKIMETKDIVKKLSDISFKFTKNATIKISRNLCTNLARYVKILFSKKLKETSLLQILSRCTKDLVQSSKHFIELCIAAMKYILKQCNLKYSADYLVFSVIRHIS